MKKLTTSLFAIIFLTACDNPQNGASTSTVATTVDSTKNNEAADAKTLNDFLKKYEEPSQTFNIPSGKSSEIKGKQGTVISVDPADLTTENGQALGTSIDVELKELTNQSQLLKSNAQTISDGKLLVSGGAYYINMTSGGQQLKLKEGKSLNVKFPKISTDNMDLFYGQRNELGQMNWKPSDKTFAAAPTAPAPDPGTKKGSKKKGQTNIDELVDFISGKDTTTSPKYRHEVQLEKKVYSAIKIEAFGWINCDHFLNVPNLTNVVVKLDQQAHTGTTTVLVIFKDIKCVLQNFSFTKNPDINFPNIPIGYKVRLVAFSIKDEKVYTFSSDLTVKANETNTIALKETSEDDFKKLMGN